MKILIKPREFIGSTRWDHKVYGVVLVEKEEDIDPLWNLLCEQDDYWENYHNLIKVAPKVINNEGDIIRMCEYCGKTDIDNIDKLREKIDFIIFQDYNVED